MTETIIGIDLGTTNSLSASVFEEGPEIIGTAQYACMVPSLLSRTGNGWLGRFVMAAPLGFVYPGCLY